MGLISDLTRKKNPNEPIEQRDFSPNDFYDLGDSQDDEPSLMELFAQWTGQRIKKGKNKLAEIR